MTRKEISAELQKYNDGQLPLDERSDELLKQFISGMSKKDKTALYALQLIKETPDPAGLALDAVIALCTPDPEDARAIIYDNLFGSCPPVYTSKTLTAAYDNASKRSEVLTKAGDPINAEKWQVAASALLEELFERYPLEAIQRGNNPKHIGTTGCISQKKERG